MGFIIFDYKCTNPDCKLHDKVMEVMHKRDEDVICKECNEFAERVACAPKSKHVSWSTWQVGLGGNS